MNIRIVIQKKEIGNRVRILCLIGIKSFVCVYSPRSLVFTFSAKTHLHKFIFTLTFLLFEDHKGMDINLRASQEVRYALYIKFQLR